jgi:hypothetical protein
MSYNFLAMAQGGEGEDVWDKQKVFSAADFKDAASQADCWARELNGQVVEISQNDYPLPKETLRLESQDAFLDHLKSITPAPPMAITWEQGNKILDAVQGFIYPPSKPRFVYPPPKAKHYSGCPANEGKPVCTCGGRYA